MSGNNDWKETNPWGADTGSSGWGDTQTNSGWGTEDKKSQSNGWGDIGWSGSTGNGGNTDGGFSGSGNSGGTRPLPDTGWDPAPVPAGSGRGSSNGGLRSKGQAVNVQLDNIQFGKGNVQVGRAQELQCNRMQVRRGFLKAWFQSLIYGVPFYMGDTRNTFNLYPLDDNESGMDLGRQRCVMVTFFGPSDSGMIGSGQVMEVHGKFGPDRSFYASNIINRTNGTSVSVSAGLSGNVIRVITLLLVGALIYFFNKMSGGFGSGSGSSGGGLASLAIGGQSIVKLLLIVALVVGLIAFCVYKLKHPSAQMRELMRECGFFLVVILALWLVPELGALLFLIWLLKTLFVK